MQPINRERAVSGRRADLIRFVTKDRHPPYGHRTGIFQAAPDLWRARRLPAAEQAELQTLLQWFAENLTRPAKLASSARPHGAPTAMSWIRSTSTEHVGHL